MIPPPQPYTNEQIARMLEMSCKYPDIENNCAGCEYYSTSEMRKGCCDFGNDDIVRILRSHPYQSDRDTVLDDLYPPNTHVEKNGDLYGGWEIEPKSLIRLKRYIESNPQYEEEPDMEVIEVVIRAIKHELKYGKAELHQKAGEQ